MQVSSVDSFVIGEIRRQLNLLSDSAFAPLGEALKLDRVQLRSIMMRLQSDFQTSTSPESSAPYKRCDDAK